MQATYDSAPDLSVAPPRAVALHGRHEAEIGHPDPYWYAQCLVDEQAGRPGSDVPGASP